MSAHCTVLLAEDDENDVLLFSTAFRKAGMVNHLATVPDGEDAIEYLKGTGVYSDRVRYPLPDLLITDLKMPKRTGFDLLTWIKSQEQLKDLPIVVLTSSAEESDQRRALELGAQACWTKPSHFEDLVQIVHRIQDDWLAPLNQL